MILALLDKVLHRSSTWSNKKWLSGDTIVVSYLNTTILSDLLDPCSLILERITSVLSIMSIEITNSVGSLKITTIKEILLNGHITGTMFLLTHNFFFTSDWVPIYLPLTRQKIHKTHTYFCRSFLIVLDHIHGSI